MINLGIDIGGTGCKCVAFRDTGEQIAMSYREYPTKPGEVNLNALALRESVFFVISDCVKKLDDAKQVAAITVSSFGESFVPVDRSGQPLSDIILYFANTESGEFSRLIESVGAEKFMRITCVLPDASYSLAKMLYTLRTAPRPVWKFLFIASYICFCLSGETVADCSLACRSILFDVRKLCWSDELTSACGIDPETLPAVLSTATRRVLAGPLTSALLVAAPAFPLLSDSALGHNAVLGLLPLPVFSPIEATGYVGCFPTEFIGSGSGSASMLAVALIYVAVLFAVGAVATRSPKQAGPAKKHHGLELLDASVGYGSTTILSIGSLFLSPGTAAGLVAPNGSGKTTLLEALSGQFPTRIRSGSLLADGICQRRSTEFAELVYLSSSGSADLYPTLSAIEHLAFVREAWKSAADIDSLCDSLGISPYLDKPTRKLSTGMKQQVKLAMAIATDCPYLILDEPLNGLDPGKRKTSCDAMRSEVERGRSVLISSHLLDDLADLTNSFYFIEAGTLVEKIKSSSQTLKQEYLDTYEGGE